MKLFGLNPLAALRQRIGAAFGVLIISLLCCLGGVLMTFVFAPGQAVQASRISHLPVMDAQSVNVASAGDFILITGNLQGTPQAVGDSSFIAYGSERWSVSIPSADDDGPSTPTGSWTSQPAIVPELTLDMNGQSVDIHSASGVRLSGSLHGLEISAENTVTANYDGQPVSDGTMRYHGIKNGELVTVYGKKAPSGGVNPEQLFAGDRAAFEESQHQATTGFLYSGICLFVLAPIVLIGGLIAVVFRRR